MYTQRQESILKHLSDVKVARVDQMAEIFGVSIESIRRDLIVLETDGAIQRTRGGAVFGKLRAKEVEFEKKLGASQMEKIAIAKLACQHIDDGDALAISNGSSNLAFARVLAEQKNDLTVITNSSDVADILNENPTSQVFVTGGRQRKHNKSLVGSGCIDALDGFRVDKAIINIDGMTIADGITQYNVDESAVLRKMLEISHTKIILAESSKFEVVVLNRVCHAREIDLIFTDWNVQNQEISRWAEIGVHLYAAKKQ